MTYSSIVTKGQQLGRTIGFPTLNLDPKILPTDQKLGVYQAFVTWNNQEYKGILFFGPKKTFDEVINVLEINLLDFNSEIYGETVSFSLGKFIRPPAKFSSITQLEKQIAKDITLAWPN
jgi:riboflavin kinase/FMN adenylyltransferase